MVLVEGPCSESGMMEGLAEGLCSGSEMVLVEGLCSGSGMMEGLAEGLFWIMMGVG